MEIEDALARVRQIDAIVERLSNLPRISNG